MTNATGVDSWVSLTGATPGVRKGEVMIMIEIIVILVFVAMLVLLYNVYRDRGPGNTEDISFKQAYDLTTLPIITFMSGGGKYNFLLDTGSTDSHINKAIIETSGIDYTVMNAVKHVFGMEGKQVVVPMVRIELTLNGKAFEDDFLVNDLSAAFDAIKRENGVNLSGILGTTFFEKYKYVIDFQKYIAYSRR